MPKDKNEGMSPRAENAARGMALFIVGAGILGVILYFTAIPFIDLLVFCLYWLLPVAGIMVGLGLVSVGTMRTIKAFITPGMFTDKIKKHVDNIRNDENTCERVW